MVEGARLERVCSASYPGFESLPLRFYLPEPAQWSNAEPRQVREEATVGVCFMCSGHSGF